MTYEIYQKTEQQQREVIADQKAEEWGFALLEIAELVRVWGYEEIFREVRKLETDKARDTRVAAANEYYSINVSDQYDEF